MQINDWRNKGFYLRSDVDECEIIKAFPSALFQITDLSDAGDCGWILCPPGNHYIPYVSGLNPVDWVSALHHVSKQMDLKWRADKICFVGVKPTDRKGSVFNAAENSLNPNCAAFSGLFCCVCQPDRSSKGQLAITGATAAISTAHFMERRTMVSTNYCVKLLCLVSWNANAIISLFKAKKYRNARLSKVKFLERPLLDA